MASFDRDVQQVGVSLKELIAQFEQFKTLVFSGSLLVEVNNTPSWTFFFRLGRLSWQSGGANPDERWQRHLALFCPGTKDPKTEQNALGQDPQVEYSILTQLLGQGLVQRQQLADLMVSAATETLFDVIQSCQTNGGRLSYKLIPDNPSNKLGSLLPLVEIGPLLRKAIQTWQEWLKADLAIYSPNLYPVIQQPDLLQTTTTSASTYQLITSLVDGTQTLRGLAVKSNQDIVTLTQSLLPLIELKVIAVSKVPVPSQLDFSAIKQVPPKVDDSDSVVVLPEKKPLVACIDDSPVVCQALEKIIKQHGYSFMDIQNSLKALPMLLRNKPDFIFLDLLMPITNGYEVCAQLRKTPSLKDVPIVILTGRDGLVDRMRAKMVGSTDFLPKPVEAEQVLKMINKYLPNRR